MADDKNEVKIKDKDEEEKPRKKDAPEKEVEKPHRKVCSITGLQVLDLGKRSITFKSMQPVEITSAEFNHPNFQSRINNFKEVN